MTHDVGDDVAWAGAERHAHTDLPPALRDDRAAATLEGFAGVPLDEAATAALREELREKTAILNALYMPKAPAEVFSAGMTPVNTFRHVLKHYFDVPIEPLPDRSLIFESAENLYHFKDVTGELTSP